MNCKHLPLCAVLGLAVVVGCSSGPGSQELDDTEWIGPNSVEVNARIKSSLTRAATGTYAELATDAELQNELVTTHITYAKTGLEAAGYYLNMLPDQIVSLQASVAGNSVTISYEASIDMVLPSSGSINAVDDLPVKRLDVRLPQDPVDVYARGGTNCASDYGSYTLSESKYFYYFDPDQPNCAIALSNGTIEAVKVYPQPEVYPEYDRLLNDLGDGTRGFQAAILPNRGDNDAMSRYNAHRTKLNQATGLNPEKLDGFERYRWNKGGATILIDLFDPTDGWFASDFHSALSSYQLVFYNGHSNYGNQPFLDKPEVYSDDYQIIGMHSCKSYSYYAHQVATGKATADDPTGWQNADMIATGRSSYPHDSPDVLAALLEGLMDGLRAIDSGSPTKAPSWQEIGERMGKVAPRILYGIAGARNNTWSPDQSEPQPEPEPEPATECAHDRCEIGIPLEAACDPCVAQIIAADAWCGSDAWDEMCVEQVSSVCGLSCE